MSIEEVLQQLAKRLEKLEQRVAAIDSREENGFTGLDTRCDYLSADVTVLKNEIEGVKDDVFLLKRKVVGRGTGGW